MTEDRSLTLRPATLDDSRLLHAWRNDPETRRASRSTSIVPWTSHEPWMMKSLSSPDRVIRIAEENGVPVGVVRADRSPDGWELSWTVAPPARGREIGRRMLILLMSGLDGRITAIIRRGNTASARVATAAGLVRVSPAADRGFDRWARE